MFNRIFMITLVSSATLLTGCATSNLSQVNPPTEAQTATLSYDIDPSTYYKPQRFLEHGYKERIDIQLVPSYIVAFINAGSDSNLSSGINVYSSYDEGNEKKEVNKFVANETLRFSYQHKVVNDSGARLGLCYAYTKAKFEPNRTYVLKGETTTSNSRTEKMFPNTSYDSGQRFEKEDISCRIQIIDAQTHDLIADSDNTVFKGNLSIYDTKPFPDANTND